MSIVPTLTQLASSAFTGTDENPISEGGVWTTAPTLNAFRRLSNTAIPANFNGDAGAYRNDVSWTNNQYTKGDLTYSGVNTAESGTGFMLRQSTSTNTHYRFVINHAASNNASINRHVSGVYTNLVSWTQTFVDGDTFIFGIEGQKLYVYRTNSSTLVKIYDDTGGGGPTSGSVALAYSSPISGPPTVIIDNWSGGTFSTTFDVTTPGSYSISGTPTVLRPGATTYLRYRK